MLQRDAMDALSRFFVQQPLHIMAVAAGHGVLWAVLRFSRVPRVSHVDALLVPTLPWSASGVWEWRVLVQPPEANIRVDLLIVWPLLALLTAWALARLAGWAGR
jgi:hypothetical protein